MMRFLSQQSQQNVLMFQEMMQVMQGQQQMTAAVVGSLNQGVQRNGPSSRTPEEREVR